MQIVMRFFFAVLLLPFSLFATQALAQEAHAIGATKDEVSVVGKGWSMKNDVMNKDVYTDGGKEKIGTIDDIIVTMDKSVSYAIVSSGGFLGIAKHDVVIPVSQLKSEGTRIILPGATKESIKAMSPFVYTK